MRRGSKEKLKHLIYSSRPVHFDATVVDGILTSSKENNTKSGVTGALIYRQDLFLQFLEGPEDQVEQTYIKIIEDRFKNKIVLSRNGKIRITDDTSEKYSSNDSKIIWKTSRK